MRRITKKTLLVLGVPTLYAVIVRLFFGVHAWSDLFSVMSLSFLLLLPTIVGALTVCLSSPQQAGSVVYRIFAPWISVLLFFALTMILALEGWACWVMILPIFLIASSIGGFIGGYLKSRGASKKMSVSVLVFVPFMLAPLESSIERTPAVYYATTYIDISAPAEKIWDNVTRVQEIPLDQDRGYLTRALGFPRPVKAEVNFEGVGAYREAVFTNGLIFHETVVEYVDNKKMVFRIKAYPHEIPSTTLDEHVVIGGEFFDVLNGTYELEQLADGRYRLHLYSSFQMNTLFNFYTGWWGKWIITDIQNNILQIQRYRSENGE